MLHLDLYRVRHFSGKEPVVAIYFDGKHIKSYLVCNLPEPAVDLQLANDMVLTAEQINRLKVWAKAHDKSDSLNTYAKRQSFIRGLRKGEYVGYGDGSAPSYTRKYPTEKEVLHWFNIERQMLRESSNEDGEISHPAVTQRYVEEFCRLNHLTRG